ncbi:MAG: trimeric intracellular cation channel family protein [Lachnospiraceae bacterium]|nr:trimeric intracellular cation channel family protein [Lachnospiraceae bacterium]
MTWYYEMSYAAFVILIMEITGTIAFAASGAMLAIKKGMDVFGVCVLGVVTAVGGGMLRDVVLGKVPSALLDPVYTGTAAVTSLLLFLLVYRRQSLFHGKGQNIYEIFLFWMDAIGLGIFTVVGVSAGYAAGYGGKTFLLVFLGTITGVGGGLLRDMMAQEAPYILVKHIYACASILGAVVYVLTYRSFGELPALIVSPAVVVLIRWLAAHYGWNLPRIRRTDQF